MITRDQALTDVRVLADEWNAGARKDDAVRDELIARVRVAFSVYVPEYTIMTAAGVSRTTVRKWCKGVTHGQAVTA